MKIFKYTDTAGANHILRNQTIRYTPLLELNDPFEGSWDIDMSAEWNKLSVATIRRRGLVIPPDISDIKKKQLPKLRAGLEEELAAVIKKMAAFCASEINNDVAMWSYYADQHRGAVIGFNGNHKIFDLTGGIYPSARKLQNVFYQDEVPLIPSHPDPRGAKDYTKAYFTKGTHWKHEREVRMILPVEHLKSTATSPVIWTHVAPSDAVTDLIIGRRMPAGDRDALMRLVKSESRLRHIKIHEAQASQDRYALELIQLLV